MNILHVYPCTVSFLPNVNVDVTISYTDVSHFPQARSSTTHLTYLDIGYYVSTFSVFKIQSVEYVQINHIKYEI